MSKIDNSQYPNGEDVQEMKKEIVRKVIVDPDIITKMKRLASLYSDELPEGAKEIDVISFFLCKSFNLFLKSGEIERKLDEIKGM
jgi:hypothetical protein